jgi:hypothetical protein
VCVCARTHITQREARALTKAKLRKMDYDVYGDADDLASAVSSPSRSSTTVKNTSAYLMDEEEVIDRDWKRRRINGGQAASPTTDHQPRDNSRLTSTANNESAGPLDDQTPATPMPTCAARSLQRGNGGEHGSNGSTSAAANGVPNAFTDSNELQSRRMVEHLLNEFSATEVLQSLIHGSRYGDSILFAVVNCIRSENRVGSQRV